MKKLFFAIFLISNLLVHAQFAQIDTIKFYREVKQIAEFTDRFNGIEDTTQVVQSNDSKTQESRKKIISTLFNQADTELTDTGLPAEFIEFVADANNPYYLNFSDSLWFAVAHLSINLHSEEKAIDVSMRLEGSKTKGFKWVIAGVDPSLFTTELFDEITTPSIGPLSHELNFIDFYRVFDNPNAIANYATNEFSENVLSNFLFAIKSGLVTLNHVEGITFYFCQIPGWVFTVDYFNNFGYNSGWLISSVRNLEPQNIDLFLNTTLHIKSP